MTGRPTSEGGRRPGQSPPPALLAGKQVLITGVASSDSIAFATARAAIRGGATVIATALHRDLDRAREACASLPGAVDVLAFDVTDPAAPDDLVGEIHRRYGTLDGALHAIAFAPRDALAAMFGVEAASVDVAFRTSVQSYVILAGVLAECAPVDGASLVGLDFDAGRAWPTYNWMGVMKAALEGASRYVARDLGQRRIRSNLVAAGPLRTRAASAIPGFEGLVRSWEEQAPLRWDPDDAAPVADAVCFLLSDLARAVTGEILHVDAGHHAVAAPLSGDRER